VGQKTARFIDRWFGGIQQYALRFIYEWEALAPPDEAKSAEPVKTAEPESAAP
jgi:hypothetical protein